MLALKKPMSSGGNVKTAILLMSRWPKNPHATGLENETSKLQHSTKIPYNQNVLKRIRQYFILGQL